MSCSPILDPSGCVAEVAKDAVTQMAQAFADSAGWTVKNMMTLWLNVPSPDVSSAGSSATWLSDLLGYFVLVAALVSVLWAAYRMATSGSFEHVSELAGSLGRLLIVSGVVAGATTIALQVGDAVAAWVLASSDFKPSAAEVLVLPAVAPGTTGLVIVLALVVILTQIIQAVLMLVKSVMVVLLVGFLPLTAGATNLPVGRAGFHRALTWLAAFLLYKPVAAIIYATSFKLSSRDQTLAGQMSGIALMVLAVFALPALMKFLAPITASATGGNAGAMAGAVVGAAVATGAVLATGGAAAGGFAAAAPAAMNAGPSGASMGGATAAAGAAATSSDESETAA